MANPLASGMSALWNELAATPDHGVEAVVQLDGPQMSAGIMARSSVTASDCYYLEVISDPITSEVSQYGLYRRSDGIYNELWFDTLTVTASGVPITPPSGSNIRLRLEAENINNNTGVSLSAWAGTTDANLERLVAITDTHPSRILSNLYIGVMAAQPSGSLVSWDDFNFYVPYETAYHDSINGTVRGLGTELDPCSSLQNLINSVRTNKSYNGTTTIRIQENDSIDRIAIDHERHKGTSWTDPGLYITGYKKRPTLTAKQQELFEITGGANYIWIKGLMTQTDSYGGPGRMFLYNNKHLRLTSIHTLLGKAFQTQEYNDFAVGGAFPSGVASEIRCEYSFIDIPTGARSLGVFNSIMDPSGLATSPPPPTMVKLDHVIVRGQADNVIYLHGSGTVDTFDVDHVSFIDIGDDSTRGNNAILASGTVNLGPSPIFKNSIISCANNTTSLDVGVNIAIDHPFTTTRNLYWNVSTPETGVSDSSSIITTENPLFLDESVSFAWPQSSVDEHSVSGILLPKDWRPTNHIIRNFGTDNKDIGALKTVVVPATQQSTINTVIVGQLLENLRPLYISTSNHRLRYPVSHKQWNLLFSQIYKELTNLLGISFVNSNYILLGYIDTTLQYINEALERQFRYSEANTTNRYPILGANTDLFASGNYIGFFTDIDNTANLMDNLYREWN